LIDSSIQEVKRMDSLWDVAVDEGVRKGFEQGKEKGREEGLEQGREEGEKKLVQLMQILLNAGKQEEALKVVSDESIRKEYYQKYNIFD